MARYVEKRGESRKDLVSGNVRLLHVYEPRDVVAELVLGLASDPEGFWFPTDAQARGDAAC